MKRVIYFLAATMISPLAVHAADSLTQSLQHGLFEEEANQNLDAAIKATNWLYRRLKSSGK
jgi:hypothetical protein